MRAQRAARWVYMVLGGLAIACDAPAAYDREPPGDRSTGVHSVSADGDTAFLVASDDPDLRLACRVAQCTLHEFRERFQAPPVSQTDLMLKAAFRDSASTEHLWLEVLALVGDSAFRGRIANDPGMLRHLTYGDTVLVHRLDVDDWYAVDRDTLIAGFSIRAYRNRMTEVARTQYDSAQGYAVDSDRAARGRLTMRCS